MKTVFLVLGADCVCYGVFATEEAAQRYINSAEAETERLRWELSHSRIEEWVVKE